MKHGYILLLLLPAALGFAESNQAKALRTFVSDPHFSEYVAKNENEKKVKLTGIRLGEQDAETEDGKFFWRLDFEGSAPGAKLFCMGSGRSDTTRAEFPEFPIDCRLQKMTD
jgi:hypothetical protein